MTSGSFGDRARPSGRGPPSSAASDGHSRAAIRTMFRSDTAATSAQLNRWFTQRFGYRLQVDCGHGPAVQVDGRSHYGVRSAHGEQPVDVPSPSASTRCSRWRWRRLPQGPSVISLRDLVHEIRSAATDASVVALTEDPSERRALVTALRWMIARGAAAAEMHDRVDSYAADSDPPTRCSESGPTGWRCWPLPVLARADSVPSSCSTGLISGQSPRDRG